MWGFEKKTGNPARRCRLRFSYLIQNFIFKKYGLWFKVSQLILMFIISKMYKKIKFKMEQILIRVHQGLHEQPLGVLLQVILGVVLVIVGVVLGVTLEVIWGYYRDYIRGSFGGGSGDESGQSRAKF